MDLLNRRTSTASRRGARRNGSTTPATTAIQKSTIQKTTLLDEFRAHEEDVAARVLQRSARAFLSRHFVANLVQQIYRRVYDPIEKQYYYLNTTTNETTWDKPRALQMFLSATHDVPVAKGSGPQILPVAEAARRIQRVGRVYVAKKSMQTLVREHYMKLFDTETKTFYYLNTRTGERSPDRPVFLGKDDANDIPVETFQFRKAVCKLASSRNLYGSGVIGVFHGWLCLLSDATTLPDAAIASTAHVLCNYSPDASSVPFQVSLRPEQFFSTLTVDKSSTPQFALCAIDRTAFLERAGNNIQPLRFELNDRKMGCADATSGSVHLQNLLEIVGHPHGKPRVVHSRQLAKMLPHSIAPVQLVYDREMESGSAGCAVFTRGGKLLGLQHFTPLKEAAPPMFYYIRPILDAATALVTPPEPFLLTTSLSSHDIHACWSIVRWYQPLSGLAITYELELGCPSDKALSLATFANVYRGVSKSKYIGELQSDRLYALRVRAKNPMATSSWSHVLTFRTLPMSSLAWRIPRYCTSIREACTRMKQQPQDPVAQLQGVQWIARHVGQHPDTLPDCEIEFLDASGLDWMLENITSRYPEKHTLVVGSMRLLITLAQIQRRTQRLLSQVHYMETLIGLVSRHLPRPDQNPTRSPDQSLDPDPEEIMDSMAIPLSCVELLGAILDGDNASAQQTAQSLDLVPTLLAVLSANENRVLQTHAPFVAECVFVFARYTHHHTLAGNWQFVDTGRVAVLRDLLTYYADSGASTIVYWTLVTLGNIAYASSTDFVTHDQLESETRAFQLVVAVGYARTQYLLRIHELGLAVGTAEREYARLAASLLGDTMRNELDACEHEILTLRQAIQQLNDQGDVAAAADFALRYLLTADQHRVQAAAQQLLRNFMLRKSTVAFAKWVDATVFDRNCSVVRKFLTTVKNRQLSAAFRKWERYLRDWRRNHQSVLVDAVLGAGLAIDLNKRNKQRYRILALQK